MTNPHDEATHSPYIPNGDGVIPYPDEHPAVKHRFARVGVYALVSTFLLTLVAVVTFFISKGHDSDKFQPAAFKDYCSDTSESAALRGKLLYTDARYMKQKPAQTSADSENPSQKWCVIGTSYESDMWWALTYVGEDNPVYKAMFAENGYADDATRAVITYQGIPPIKFARDGWIAFITPSETDETWSEFKTGAGAMLLTDIAERSEKGK